MTKKTPKLVTVEWKDVLGTAGWEKPEEVNPPVIFTVGYLILKNKDVVKIAHTRDEKGAWSGITAFPSGCVRSIKNISS